MLSADIYNLWFAPLRANRLEGNCLTLEVANEFCEVWLKDNYMSLLQQVLGVASGRHLQVQFKVAVTGVPLVNNHPAPTKAKVVEASTEKNPAGGDLLFNPKNTFDTFVVGNNNNFSYAAALAVAQAPGKSYNPLFLYGGVGLGKTHLLHAMGNLCLEHGLMVLYVTSEDFTNDLINSIRSRTTEAFREKYRRIDVLLIDDIQFIAGKESTQEEFFHTFNALHGQNRQLVLSSDRPPKAMVTLEERLRSRFEWGLTADIQPPDIETRVAILRSKAERAGRTMPPELLEIIARRVQSNIRELEGALIRVLALSDLSGVPIGLELVESALADMLPKNRRIAPATIIEAVATQFDIGRDKLLGRERTRDVVLPRQIAMYLIREETNASLPEIGNALGGRDHTTIMYGIDKINELMEKDDNLRRQIMAIRQQLYQPSMSAPV